MMFRALGGWSGLVLGSLGEVFCVALHWDRLDKGVHIVCF